MNHELHIITGDGWVVMLQTDKQVDLGGIAISSIIVQPREDHEMRIRRATEPVYRTEYRLHRNHPDQSHMIPGICGGSKAPEGWFCTRHAGHSGPCAERKI